MDTITKEKILSNIKDKYEEDVIDYLMPYLEFEITEGDYESANFILEILRRNDADILKVVSNYSSHSVSEDVQIKALKYFMTHDDLKRCVLRLESHGANYYMSGACTSGKLELVKYYMNEPNLRQTIGGHYNKISDLLYHTLNNDQKLISNYLLDSVSSLNAQQVGNIEQLPIKLFNYIIYNNNNNKEKLNEEALNYLIIERNFSKISYEEIYTYVKDIHMTYGKEATLEEKVKTIKEKATYINEHLQKIFAKRELKETLEKDLQSKTLNTRKKL